MRSDTRRALRSLDRRFYLRHADGFAGSRRLAWPGWDRALAGLEPSDGALRVLDAGCAHGRLAPILGERYPDTRIDYLGLDSCLPLLTRGASGGALGPPSTSGHSPPTGAVSTRFVQADLLAPLPLPSPAPSSTAGRAFARDHGFGGFDLIALFGVLHHIPGHATRRDLLIRLGDLLAPGGRFVVTVWRVERQPRFASKRVPWSRFNSERHDSPYEEAAAGAVIEPSDLEDGDHLLSWGGDFETPRYCHATSDQEADALAAAAGLAVADRFEADGPLEDRNLYLVLNNP